METSETIRLIAEGLKICGAREEVALAVLSLLETPEQEEAMLDYILELGDALEKPETAEKLLEKAVELTR